MPRTQRIEQTCYRFSELSETAKERAIQRYCEMMPEDWHECVIDDAKTCFGFLGYSIDDVFFSGFSSQGDGACFEGTWNPEAVNAQDLKEHAPTDKELHRLADAMQEFAAVFTHSSANIKHTGRYCHEHSVSIDLDLGEAEVTRGESWEIVSDEADNTFTDITRDCMHWIYKTLEKEYEYQTSEEQVSETSEANEWEYDENGDMI